MARIAASDFSYRNDPAVPHFDDSKAVFVFDGICVLCSTGVSWIMRNDRHGRVNFATAQSPLGQALYRHYGVEIDGSYLLVEGGRAYTESAGYLRAAEVLGGSWHLFRIAAIIPERLRDAIYGLFARKRYDWFGKSEFCALLTEDQRRRLL